MNLGVLSLQGDFIDHIRILKKLGLKPIYVKEADDLNSLDALIIPGGESTVISKLLQRRNIFEALKNKISNGLFVYGTCAGAILLSKTIEIHKSADDNIQTLNAIDLKISRNSYGSQIDSFSSKIYFKKFEKNIEVFFIRAPKIIEYNKEKIECLMEHDGYPVMLRQDNILVSTFHSELDEETSVHEYFLSMIENRSL